AAFPVRDAGPAVAPAVVPVAEPGERPVPDGLHGQLNRATTERFRWAGPGMRLPCASRSFTWVGQCVPTPLVVIRSPGTPRLTSPRFTASARRLARSSR